MGEILDDAVEWSGSRGTLLRRAATIGAGAAGVSIFGGVAEARPTFRSARSAGSITIGLQDLYHDLIGPFVQEFTSQTGIQVTVGSVPTSGGDIVALLSPQYAAGKAPFDVHITADEFFPGFVRAGWVSPVDDVFNSIKSDYPTSVTSVMKKWMVYNGQTYAIPYGYNNGFWFQRNDVLKQLGIKSLDSWDATLAAGAKAKKKGMWIFADSVSQPDVAFVFISNLAAQAGENIFNLGKGTEQAFSYVKELVSNGYFPKVALNWTYDQQNAAYINNKIVSMRQWAFFYDAARASKKWFAADKAAIVLPPKGPKTRASWASCQGWMIPKFSSNQDQAMQFVKYITSADVASRLALANSGFVVPRASTLKAMGNKGIIPALKRYQTADVLVPRPFHLQTEKAQHFIDIAISSYLSGQQSLSTAMKNAKSGIKSIS